MGINTDIRKIMENLENIEKNYASLKTLQVQIDRID